MLSCPHCHTLNDDDAFECVDCFTPLSPEHRWTNSDSHAIDSRAAQTPTEALEPSQAVLALVLACLSWFTCGLLMSLPAFWLARHELERIAVGARDNKKGDVAGAAMWVAGINIAVSALSLVVLVFLVLS
jgi:hypothetical protein